MNPKSTRLALAAISLALVAGPALAGPDWSTIEQGRSAKRALPSNTGKMDSSAPLVLPDHGPRPQYARQKSPANSGTGSVLVAK